MLWIQSICSEVHISNINCSNVRLFSDLMKFSCGWMKACPKQSTKFCFENNYPLWYKVCLHIRSPHSIQYPQNHFVRSTYPSLPKFFKTLHSMHRCLRWCLWNSFVTRTWWPRTSHYISLPHIHRHPVEMEHYRTGSPWHLLCCNKVELLSTRIRHCCTQWPQTSTEISKWWKYKQKSKQIVTGTLHL